MECQNASVVRASRKDGGSTAIVNAVPKPVALLEPAKQKSKYSPSLGCVVPMTTYYEFEED
jgi:hypothetical protein